MQPKNKPAESESIGQKHIRTAKITPQTFFLLANSRRIIIVERLCNAIFFLRFLCKSYPSKKLEGIVCSKKWSKPIKVKK